MKYTLNVVVCTPLRYKEENDTLGELELVNGYWMKKDRIKTKSITVEAWSRDEAIEMVKNT